MTDRYAWLGAEPGPGAVVLVPQATFHLVELDRLASALREIDVEVGIALPVVPWKPLHSFRPTVRRLAQTVADSGRARGEPFSIASLLDRSAAVVVMNDWGVPRQLVESANDAGIPTYGWVEGVQDYDDVDTGLDRRAYRRVQHVFALGRASCELLGTDRSTSVGSERIRALWSAPVAADGEGALINSNFSYGVLSEARAGWVDGVVEACDRAGVSWVLSRHVAERGRTSHRVTRRPIDDLLPEAGRLISRFSTVNLDALASGVELVYHNPHGEQVDMFHDPRGAFTVTRSVGELVTALETPPRPRAEVRDGAASFLAHHVLLDAAERPAVLAARVIADRVR